MPAHECSSPPAPPPEVTRLAMRHLARALGAIRAGPPGADGAPPVYALDVRAAPSARRDFAFLDGPLPPHRARPVLDAAARSAKRAASDALVLVTVHLGPSLHRVILALDAAKLAEQRGTAPL